MHPTSAAGTTAGAKTANPTRVLVARRVKSAEKDGSRARAKDLTGDPKVGWTSATARKPRAVARVQAALHTVVRVRVALHSVARSGSPRKVVVGDEK